MKLGLLAAVAMSVAGCAAHGGDGKVAGGQAWIAMADRSSTRPAAVADEKRPKEWDLFRRETYVDGRGGELQMRVLYPEGYDRAGEKTYPLVLFLHGAGERGDDNEAQLKHGWRQFVATRERYPAIVAFPQCPSEKWWATRDAKVRLPSGAPYPPLSPEPGEMARLAMGMVEKMAETERVDPTRVYVMGLSMGGMGTWEMVERWPDRFSAAVPICGGADVEKAGNFAGKVAVWAAHGDADDAVPVKWSRDEVAALRRLDAEVLYTEFPGVGHESWTPLFAKAELLPWLYSHSKAPGERPTSRPG